MTAFFGNRVTEKDLRSWLTNNGYVGQFAKVDELELHAIKSPGWHQVFRFKIRVKRSQLNESENSLKADSGLEWVPLWGVIVDDERKRTSEKTIVFAFECPEDQQRRLVIESDGLIVPRRPGQQASSTSVMWLLTLVVAMFILGILVSYFR